MMHLRRGLSVAVPALLVLLVSAQSARTQTLSEQFDGTLQVVWGDPHPDSGAGGSIRYHLATADGRVFPLELPDASLVSTADFGKRVTLSGRRTTRLGGAAGQAATESIIVDAVAERFSPQSGFASQAVIGTRKVIYLLVKFSDDASVPHPPSFYTALNNPLTPPAGSAFPTTVNGFFSKTSWNQFTWQGDVGGAGGLGAPGGWLTLPNTKSFYAPCGWSSSCANLNALSVDAINLAKAQGISFPSYDNINFVLSNDLDCCAWGGSYSVDGKSYGATWEPPWGQEAGTYSHEMGHSLGLPHSGWKYYAYDSPWDMMSSRASASGTLCATYASKNDGRARSVTCTEPGNGYIAAHKEVLGWIPPANVATTTTSASGSWTLDGEALPLGSALKILKICLPGAACSGTGAHYITVEARVKASGANSQFDNAIPNEGIILQDVLIGRPLISGGCYFNNQSGWAVPIDSTPGDYNSTTCSYTAGTALYNAQWSPGQTYTNMAYGVDVSVISRSGSSFVVTVSPTGMTAPAAFAKTSPASGATDQASSVTLSWAAASAATSYEYCYDTTNDGACSVWTPGGFNLSAPLAGLSMGTTYYWQVRAINVKGTTYADGGASAHSSFTTAAAPSSFSKTSPTTGATGQPSSVTLSWGTSNYATSYQYCIDTTNDSACSAWTSTGTATSAALTLSVNTTYYWQVRALNSVGTTSANGGATAFWSLTTAATPPVPFNKTAPVTGALLPLASPTLTWGLSAGATSYEICYDTTANNSCDTAWTTVGTSGSAAVSGVTTGATYYWQVRAVNSVGTTTANGGSWWSFSVPVAVTVTTNPPGGIVTVDSVNYVAPKVFNWTVGTNHVVATATQQTAAGVRYSFVNWSDAGLLSHAVTAPSSATTLVANLSATATQVLMPPAPSGETIAGASVSSIQRESLALGAVPSRGTAATPSMPPGAPVPVQTTVESLRSPEVSTAPPVDHAPLVSPTQVMPPSVSASATRAGSAVKRDAEAVSVRRLPSQAETRSAGAWIADAGDTQMTVLQWTATIEFGVREARLGFTSQLSAHALWGEVRMRTRGGDWRRAAVVSAADAARPMRVELRELTGDLLEVQFVLHGMVPGDAARTDQWRIDDLQFDVVR